MLSIQISGDVPRVKLYAFDFCKLVSLVRTRLPMQHTDHWVGCAFELWAGQFEDHSFGGET